MPRFYELAQGKLRAAEAATANFISVIPGDAGRTTLYTLLRWLASREDDRGAGFAGRRLESLENEGKSLAELGTVVMFIATVI